MKTVELNLNEEEIAMLRHAILVFKTKWLKESNKVLKGKSHLSMFACLRRISVVDAIDLRLEAAEKSIE